MAVKKYKAAGSSKTKPILEETQHAWKSFFAYASAVRCRPGVQRNRRARRLSGQHRSGSRQYRLPFSLGQYRQHLEKPWLRRFAAVSAELGFQELRFLQRSWQRQY